MDNTTTIIAKNKSEFGAKKRELVELGYRCYDYPSLNRTEFMKNDGCNVITIEVRKGWKKQP